MRCCKASKESQSNTSVADSKAANMSLRGRAHDFCSIGRRALIGLCFFYRMETSAPGLSGHYWYLDLFGLQLGLGLGLQVSKVMYDSNHIVYSLC